MRFYFIDTPSRMCLSMVVIFIYSLFIGENVSAQKCNVFLQDERLMPSDSLWISIVSSLTIENFNEKEVEFQRLHNFQIKKKHYAEALFLSNEFAFSMNEKIGSRQGVVYIKESLARIPSKKFNDSIEYFISQYYLANISDSPDNLVYYKNIENSSCLTYSAELYFLSQLNYGVALMQGNFGNKAMNAWQYCLDNLAESPYKAEAYFKIGKALGEKDAETSLLLLKNALKISEDDDPNNKQFQYECLREIVQIYVRVASDEDEAQSTDFMAEKYSYKAHLILQDSSFKVHEDDAANSIYRIASESLIWLGKDSLVSEYMHCYLNNKSFYTDEYLTEGFVYILQGVNYYVKGDFELSNVYFKLAIEQIGSATSYLNYYLELAYAYVGSNYHMQGDFDLAIAFMEKSIKTLLPSYYETIDDAFEFIPVDDVVKSDNAYNVIMCLLRIQYFHQLDLYSGADKKLLLKAEKLTVYIDNLIKAWFLNAADNETLTLATKLIKRNNAIALDLLYWNNPKDSKDIADDVFLLSTEASSFYLNYLKNLKGTNREHAVEDSLLSRIQTLSRELNQYDDDVLGDDVVLNSLALLKCKMLLSEKDHVDMQPYIHNSKLPGHTYIQNNASAVIKYFISDTILYIVYFTPEGKGVEQVVFNDYKEEVNRLKRMVKSGGDSESLQREFYNKLIAPVVNSLKGVEHLRILSDELLGNLPFEMFLDEHSRLLINKYSIKYFYSNQNLNNSFTANAEHTNFVGIAPGFINQNNSSSPWRSGLSPLYNSIKEIEQLDSLCLKEQVNSSIYLKDDATLDAFYSSIESADILHIATHGVSVKDKEKGLYFSSSASDPGFLSLSDLYAVDIHANIVVLAACKAAVGEVATGEGVMALPRGFMFAGVPNVMATLWNVDDEKATELMVSFYTHLWEDKCSYAEALRKAKIDCISKGFLPLDWAAFILITN